MLEFSGKTETGIPWTIVIKRTPNADHHAVVTVSTWSAISEDRPTMDAAKQEGENMKESMIEELEGLING